MSRTFFNSAEAPEALFIMQALKFSAVYKSIKVHLGQGQDLIMSIQIYFEYITLTKMLDFVHFVLDEFKILRFSNVTDYRNFP